jgi:hypothetical protein
MGGPGYNELITNLADRDGPWASFTFNHGKIAPFCLDKISRDQPGEFADANASICKEYESAFYPPGVRKT